MWLRQHRPDTPSPVSLLPSSPYPGLRSGRRTGNGAPALLISPTSPRIRSPFGVEATEEMAGNMLGTAFDLKSGQMIMVALLLMIGSFYAGTLFGNNKAPIYVTESESDNSTSPPSPSPGTIFLSVSVQLSYRCFVLYFICRFLVEIHNWAYTLHLVGLGGYTRMPVPL